MKVALIAMSGIRVCDQEAWERCTLFDINFRPKGMSVDELRAGFHRLCKRLYSEDFTHWRRKAFGLGRAKKEYVAEV